MLEGRLNVLAHQGNDDEDAEDAIDDAGNGCEKINEKLKPNLWRARAEPCHNSKTSSTVTRTTEAANKKVIIRAISSPSRSRERNEREPATGPAPGTVVVVVATLLDVVERLQFLCDDFLGKLRVGQGLGVVLTVREHPLNESFDGVALSGVGKLSWNKQPCKTGDGVCSLARSVRNGNAEIVRHVFCCGSRRGSDACKVCLDEGAGRVFHATVSHVVLDRVDQLNIAERIRSLLNHAGHPLVAFLT